MWLPITHNQKHRRAIDAEVRDMKKYIYLLVMALFSCIAISVKAQTNPIKQTVDGYFFNGGFNNSITKVELYLEDDYIVGYSNKGYRKATKRKLKIKKNPNAYPYQVSDPMNINSYNRMGYLAYWGNAKIYFDLVKSVEIHPEVPLDVYDEKEVDNNPYSLYKGGEKEIGKCLALASDCWDGFISKINPENPNGINIKANYIIDKEGKVTDVYVVESTDHSLDEAFVDTLKKAFNQYKIRPAIRDGKEVGFKGEFKFRIKAQ